METARRPVVDRHVWIKNENLSVNHPERKDAILAQFGRAGQGLNGSRPCRSGDMAGGEKDTGFLQRSDNNLNCWLYPRSRVRRLRINGVSEFKQGALWRRRYSGTGKGA